MRSLIFAILILFLLPVNAQDLTQVLRGTVSSNDGQKLSNISVFAKGEKLYTTTTDSLGKFFFTLDPGRYLVYANATGYHLPGPEQVTIYSAKQVVLDLEMSRTNYELQTVVINSEQRAGTVGITGEKMQRTAAAFYDPARVVTSHAAAINTDDQANNITVHGISPSYNQWTLEGADIVNPNHLENAGTVNDRPSMNGGGVCILSAQLMKNSSFDLAPSQAKDANCVSGIFKIDLRNGNDEKSEQIVQASLLGTDLSTEGPFSKKHKASYLINARYSTIGLLSKMGVDFGDEQITYGDISWKLSFPHNRGRIGVFGFAGSSTTEFAGKKTTEDILVEKDLNDIHYSSFTAASGISSALRLSKNVSLKNVIVYSAKEVEREQDPLNIVPAGDPRQTDDYGQQKLGTLHYFSFNFRKNTFILIGTHVNFIDNKFSIDPGSGMSSSSIRETLVLPFISADIPAGKKIQFTFGLNGFGQGRIHYFSLQPMAEMKIRPGSSQTITLRYSMGAQLQPALLYVPMNNRNLRPTTLRTSSLTHLLQLNAVSFNTELYLSEFDHIPVAPVIGFSAFNYLNEFVPYTFEQTGKAKVYGVDETAKLENQNFYLIASAGLFKSQYSIHEKYRDSRFSSGYNAVVTLGKEFIARKGKWSSDLRATSRNGFKELVFLSSSEDMTYGRTLPSYYRFDLRIAYTREKLKRSTIWALDIQNVTNRKNVVYHYYDDVTGKTETKYQLGIIPVLSYKVLF